jgi:demethylmenaquinone methyltransferase/2-methoxy-6-polyprenyl-1,4-benzoquinol methylase
MAEWTKKREVIHHYDFSAPVYDAQYAEEQNAKMKVALNSTNINKDSIVLDAGCGTGLLFKHIEQTAKLIVGLDISLKILKKAKKHVKQLPKVAVIRADADFIPFQNNIFDTTFAITLLQNMSDPLVTLNELKRVSKNHATLIITGLKKEFSKETFMKLLRKVRLNVSAMKTNSQINGIIVICRKTERDNT